MFPKAAQALGAHLEEITALMQERKEEILASEWRRIVRRRLASSMTASSGEVSFRMPHHCSP